MSANVSNNTPDSYLVKVIRDIQKQIRAMRTNQNSVFVVPHYTSDPASPIDDQMWINDTSHTFKIRVNGVTKTVTLT